MLSSLWERNSGAEEWASWQMPSAGHRHVDSAQDQFPEGVLGFTEQLKSPLSQQGTRGLVIAALCFCTRSVNHTSCFWRRSKPLLRRLQTGLSKMSVALEESQQIPRRLWEVQCCLHYKKQGAFQRGANGWFISGSFSTLPRREPPQHHITALSTVWMAQVSTTSVLLGRTQTHPHQVLWRHEIKSLERRLKGYGPKSPRKSIDTTCNLGMSCGSHLSWR